jgi:hypothetical protein
VIGVEWTFEAGRDVKDVRNAFGDQQAARLQRAPAAAADQDHRRRIVLFGP